MHNCMVRTDSHVNQNSAHWAHWTHWVHVAHWAHWAHVAHWAHWAHVAHWATLGTRGKLMNNVSFNLDDEMNIRVRFYDSGSSVSDMPVGMVSAKPVEKVEQKKADREDLPRHLVDLAGPSFAALHIHGDREPRQVGPRERLRDCIINQNTD